MILKHLYRDLLRPLIMCYMLLVLMLGMSMKATAQARMVDSLKRELEKKNITVEKTA
ncbi:hypothetical protein VJ786_04090 [Sphingobacterium sp. PU5-4]|uniref:Uncharacterized protein n=1 Tax=Sphingobacterium tenebrionis TaxID=3111775 RepID=A0ABU8I3L7_9SPHI